MWNEKNCEIRWARISSRAQPHEAARHTFIRPMWDSIEDHCHNNNNNDRRKVRFIAGLLLRSLFALRLNESRDESEPKGATHDGPVNSVKYNKKWSVWHVSGAKCRKRLAIAGTYARNKKIFVFSYRLSTLEQIFQSKWCNANACLSADSSLDSERRARSWTGNDAIRSTRTDECMDYFTTSESTSFYSFLFLIFARGPLLWIISALGAVCDLIVDFPSTGQSPPMDGTHRAQYTFDIWIWNACYSEHARWFDSAHEWPDLIRPTAISFWKFYWIRFS